MQLHASSHLALRFGSCALTLPFAVAVWSDDDWLKKFSGKTLEESAEEAGAEAPKPEVQEVGKTTGAICIPAVPKAESASPAVSGGRAEECHLNLLFSFPAQGEPPAKKSRANPQVYMDIKIGNKPAGRLQILLRSDVVPMTVGEERVSLPSVVASSCDTALTSLPLPLNREFPLPLHPRERLRLQREQLPPHHPPVHVPGW